MKQMPVAAIEAASAPSSADSGTTSASATPSAPEKSLSLENGLKIEEFVKKYGNSFKNAEAIFAAMEAEGFTVSEIEPLKNSLTIHNKYALI